MMPHGTTQKLIHQIILVQFDERILTYWMTAQVPPI